jgi:predicted nucleic acid-binding Zn ribbon protein
MICPTCSKEIPNGSLFCNLCGKPTQSENSQQNTAKMLFMLCLGLGVATMGIAFYLRSAGVKNSPSPTSVQSVQAAPALVQVSKNLVEGQLLVRNHSDIRYKLEIDTTKMLNPVVSGSFQASGGVGNDIRVVLVDEDSFVNWSNGHQAQALYDSERTTIGKLKVPITRSGTYYLVFSNRFSAFTPKQVFANMTLSYQALPAPAQTAQ